MCKLPRLINCFSRSLLGLQYGVFPGRGMFPKHEPRQGGHLAHEYPNPCHDILGKPVEHHSSEPCLGLSAFWKTQEGAIDLVQALTRRWTRYVQCANVRVEPVAAFAETRVQIGGVRLESVPNERQALLQLLSYQPA